MRLFVIGATGGTGRHVVTQALERGDEVTAYVRSLYKMEDLTGSEGLRVTPGVLEDVDRMAAAMEGCDAVVVTLGPPQRPATFLRCRLLRDSLPVVEEAMGRAGVSRLVVLSAWGVGDTARTASAPVRLGFATAMRAVYTDHAEAEEALRASGRIDLTTVHPVILTDGADDSSVVVRPLDEVRHVPGVPKVSRRAVAAALIDAAHDPATVGKTILVATGEVS